MIAVDSSALLAILLQEAEAEVFSRRIAEDGGAFLPQAAALEIHMVARGQRDPTIADDFDDLLLALSITIAPLNAHTHLSAARDAFDRYGKGRGHPAQLNFGDCLVYGFAKAESLPLLFKGRDFAQTDIVPA